MLIDNKDALTAVDDCNYKIMSGYEWIRKQEIKKRLKELPSAERKGKWVNHRNDDGHNIADCNLCGSTLQWFDNDGAHNYCPNCGARMVSEDD